MQRREARSKLTKPAAESKKRQIYESENAQKEEARPTKAGKCAEKTENNDGDDKGQANYGTEEAWKGI